MSSLPFYYLPQIGLRNNNNKIKFAAFCAPWVLVWHEMRLLPQTLLISSLYTHKVNIKKNFLFINFAKISITFINHKIFRIIMFWNNLWQINLRTNFWWSKKSERNSIMYTWQYSCWSYWTTSSNKSSKCEECWSYSAWS